MKRIAVTMVFMVLALMVWSGHEAAACTIGVADGERTENGQALLWKSRMWSDGEGDNHIVRKNTSETGYVYDFIGIKGTSNSEIRMGVNTAGLATGNALFGGSGNSFFMEYALGNFATVDEVEAYLQQELQAGNFTARSAFAFIDADGNAVLFETWPPTNTLYVYDCLDEDRTPQNYGWVVRDNRAHRNSNGTDDPFTDGRYYTAWFNSVGLIDEGVLSALTAMQGNDGSADYELVRYGPGRVLDTIATPDPGVGQTPACGAIAVEGVSPGTNPSLMTMWTALGRSNYAISVPIWIAANHIPGPMSSSEMSELAYDMFASVEHDEATVQARIFPAEKHLFDEIEELMKHWWFDYAGATEVMARVEEQMATDAHSLLLCLANDNQENYAPTVEMKISKKTAPSSPYPGLNDKAGDKGGDLTFHFEAHAEDSDGTVDSYRWDFGDDSDDGFGQKVTHTFLRSGWYLISCTVEDNEDVSTTDWQYLLVGEQCGGIAGFPCTKSEFCKHPDDTCDWSDHFGVCTRYQYGCDPGGVPVCGCDGVTYENECFSENAGVSVFHDGECEDDLGSGTSASKP